MSGIADLGGMDILVELERGFKVVLPHCTIPRSLVTLSRTSRHPSLKHQRISDSAEATSSCRPPKERLALTVPSFTSKKILQSYSMEYLCSLRRFSGKFMEIFDVSDRTTGTIPKFCLIYNLAKGRLIHQWPLS